MLYFFSGTDAQEVREAASRLIEKHAKKASVVRITDAHTVADLEVSLLGSGLFGGEKVVVFDNVYANDAMRDVLTQKLSTLAKQKETFVMIEGALDAATRKSIEKYATDFERFDEKKLAKKETIFGLANALQSGKKKELWVGYQRELYEGKAPEAILGVLFWAAKQALLRSDTPRNRDLVARLAELPHEARRSGFDLEYALEHFVLS